MNKAQRLAEKLQRKRKINRQWATLESGLVLAVVWGMYLLRAVFGIDFRPSSDNGPAISPTAALIAAIIGTFAAVAWFFWRVGRADALAERGVQTIGTITAVGILRRRGMSPVTLTFTAEGKQFTVRRDMLRSEYSPGQSVILRYDPKNPKNWEIVR